MLSRTQSVWPFCCVQDVWVSVQIWYARCSRWVDAHQDVFGTSFIFDFDNEIVASAVSLVVSLQIHCACYTWWVGVAYTGKFLGLCRPMHSHIWTRPVGLRWHLPTCQPAMDFWEAISSQPECTILGKNFLVFVAGIQPWRWNRDPCTETACSWGIRQP